MMIQIVQIDLAPEVPVREVAPVRRAVLPSLAVVTPEGLQGHQALRRVVLALPAVPHQDLQKVAVNLSVLEIHDDSNLSVQLLLKSLTREVYA